MSRQRQEIVGLFGDGEKRGGPKLPVLGMAPARQSFDANDLARSDGNLRLEKDIDFAPSQGRAKIGLERCIASSTFPRLAGNHQNPSLVRRLRVSQRGTGPPEELARILIGIMAFNHAHPARKRDQMRARKLRTLKLNRKLLGKKHHAIDLHRPFNTNDEFGARRPRDDRALAAKLADQCPDLARDRLQEHVPRVASEGCVDHFEARDVEQQDVEFSPTLSYFDPATRGGGIAHARQRVPTTACYRFAVMIELLDRAEKESPRTVEPQMLRDPRFPARAVGKHVRESRRPAIRQDAADRFPRGLAILCLQLAKQGEHAHPARRPAKPAAQRIAEDRLSGFDIGLPGEYAIDIDLAPTFDSMKAAGKPDCVTLRKAQRLEQLVFLERAGEIVGCPSLDESIEPIDIIARYQDKQRAGVDFDRIGQGPHCRETIFERAARIHHRDHRRTRKKALFRIVSPARGNRLPAGVRDLRSQFIAMTERQHKQRGSGSAARRGNQAFGMFGRLHGRLIARPEPRANSPIFLPGTHSGLSTGPWLTRRPS